jgi:CPA2 family monovalent cation:H+ antiporter-2
VQDAGLVVGTLVFLATAVVTVPLCRALGVSPILGYLAAGVLLGPSGLGIVRESEPLHALSEVGLLFLLFAIGLELSLDRLRSLQRWALGLGSAQVLVSGLALAALAARWLPSRTGALVVGFSLALSSTAVVLQLLRERGELGLRHGRVSLAVLLLQDLAVVPILLAISLVTNGSAGIAPALGAAAARALAAVVVLAAAARLLLRPLYRAVAATRHSEVLLALTLLVALGTAAATRALGLSSTLGAFLAGLLVAETEYRHQVEADVEPFRGLLLGLFFLGVGLSIDVPLVREHLGMLLLLVLGILTAKSAILFPLARGFGLPRNQAAHVALVLAQAGEFGFVSLDLARSRGLIDPAPASLLLAAVALTLFATPLLAVLARRADEALAPAEAEAAAGALAEETRDLEGHAVIAGCGRVGHVVLRVLAAQGVPGVGLDVDPERVGELRRLGLPVFVGDVARKQVLEAAGVERARVVVVTIDRPDAAEALCAILRREHPALRILARARNRERLRRLLRAGADGAVAEALEGSLELSGRVLETLDLPREEIDRVLDGLRENDYARIEEWRIPEAGPEREGRPAPH